MLVDNRIQSVGNRMNLLSVPHSWLLLCFVRHEVINEHMLVILLAIITFVDKRPTDRHRRPHGSLDIGESHALRDAVLCEGNGPLFQVHCASDLVAGSGRRLTFGLMRSSNSHVNAMAYVCKLIYLKGRPCVALSVLFIASFRLDSAIFVPIAVRPFLPSSGRALHCSMCAWRVSTHVSTCMLGQGSRAP